MLSMRTIMTVPLAVPIAYAIGCGGGSVMSSPGRDGGPTTDSGVALTDGATKCPPSESACAGVCVDLQTAASDCGSCGAACAGSCTSGRCLTVFDSTPASGAIAVNSTEVYWSNSGSVLKASLAGGASSTVISGIGQVPAIALDSTYLFCVGYGDPNPDSGLVIKIPIAGGSPTTLASGPISPFGVFVNSGTVYWTENYDSGDSAILSEPVDGGTTSTVVSFGAGANAVAASNSSVFWTGSATLLSAPLTGGKEVTLAFESAGGSAFTIDSTSVYWALSGLINQDLTGAIAKIPSGGGPVVTLASALHDPVSVTVDDQFVYYSDSGKFCQNTGSYCDGAIAKVPIIGGATTTLALPGQPSGIAVDATSVYWLSDSGVMRLTPK